MCVSLKFIERCSDHALQQLLHEIHNRKEKKICIKIETIIHEAVHLKCSSA